MLVPSHSVFEINNQFKFLEESRKRFLTLEIEFEICDFEKRIRKTEPKSNATQIH